MCWAASCMFCLNAGSISRLVRCCSTSDSHSISSRARALQSANSRAMKQQRNASRAPSESCYAMTRLDIASLWAAFTTLKWLLQALFCLQARISRLPLHLSICRSGALTLAWRPQLLEQTRSQSSKLCKVKQEEQLNISMNLLSVIGS